MKNGIITCLAIAVLWAVLAVLQLWFSIFTEDTFYKISVSAGIIGGIVFVVTMAIHEYLREKDLKSNGFIDD